MKVDIPEFKKCCCCIPLRPGLIALGYLKLLSSIIGLGFVMFLTIIITTRYGYLSELLLFLIIMLLLALELSLTVVFLVGSHKKNRKLIRVYYYYSIVVLCLYLLAFLVTTILEIVFRMPMTSEFNEYEYIELKISAGLFNSLVQLYIILLIRSEVLKLKNDAKFRFSNHTTTESQCQMESAEVAPKNNVVPNDVVIDSSAVIEKNNIEKKNYKNINMDLDDHLYLNKYIKMKNEE